MEDLVWWKEVTDWQYPNHTYGLNRAGHMVAYIKASDGEMGSDEKTVEAI